MKAVVFHGIGDIRLDNVPEPKIQAPTDAIVRLGHEGVGVVEEIGSNVRNLKVGDRVVIPSTIGCGSCSYCRTGYYSQCDNANPNGPNAGTAFFGGPAETGAFQGLQAEYARIPYANV